jgi:hypothetical protein
MKSLIATSTKKTLTLWHYVSTCPIFFKDLSLVERRSRNPPDDLK